MTLALLLAVALSENHRVNRWLRTAFFFPMIIPMVSAAALWLFIFMPGLGLLDHYLAKLFGPMNNNWLGRSNSALLALALIGVWKFAGYYMLFFLAGLQSIPASTREAALMEGATRTQVFFKVTLPLLRPTLSFVITTALIYSITQIDHVAVMTRGGRTTPPPCCSITSRISPGIPTTSVKPPPPPSSPWPGCSPSR
ncbi:N-Acetyl-D-glucosamine ABC transport system, permease protein [Klebsiella pneumoniae]|uniref:N-Acetyl-D-glucosamine ABC transport system, permease protein n=1 Tax=Klebsiella pneumoniae TaxID=573 RepID=A0A2X3E6Z9_KLEPN|nr:N-Acetyl-D-glucosamine ABC transport system, permease protein [Klebsiella pneumoniae]